MSRLAVVSATGISRSGSSSSVRMRMAGRAGSDAVPADGLRLGPLVDADTDTLWGELMMASPYHSGDGVRRNCGRQVNEMDHHSQGWNLYPAPCTVRKWRGLAGSSSSFCRSLRIWLSTLRVVG